MYYCSYKFSLICVSLFSYYIVECTFNWINVRVFEAQHLISYGSNIASEGLVVLWSYRRAVQVALNAFVPNRQPNYNDS